MAGSKSTATVGLAAHIVRHVLGCHPGTKNTIAVNLPRKSHPVYLMPTKQAQPWGLLPTKAAAYLQYPNFFNNSCMFFSSIDRDIRLNRPTSIMRVSKLALDLAKVLRNLGIVGSFQVGQKLDQLGDHEYVWQQNLEPEHASELKLYNYKYLQLNLRWDLYKPVWGSPQQTLSQTPLDVPEALPLSVRNISRASQPVYLTPGVLKQELQRYPSGIFLMYHPQLGVTTDAALALLQEPGLVMAHLGLPYSHVAQIHACLKHKLQEQQEQGQALEQALSLRDWSMVDYVQERLAERRQQLGTGPQVELQKRQIQDFVARSKAEGEAFISDFDVSRTLHKELIAWQLQDKLAPRPQSQGPSQGEGSTGSAPHASRGWGDRGQGDRRQERDRDWRRDDSQAGGRPPRDREGQGGRGSRRSSDFGPPRDRGRG